MSICKKNCCQEVSETNGVVTVKLPASATTNIIDTLTRRYRWLEPTRPQILMAMHRFARSISKLWRTLTIPILIISARRTRRIFPST